MWVRCPQTATRSSIAREHEHVEEEARCRDFSLSSFFLPSLGKSLVVPGHQGSHEAWFRISERNKTQHKL